MLTPLLPPVIFAATPELLITPRRYVHTFIGFARAMVGSRYYTER